MTGTAACTATKIGQFKFLTAAHCFENSPNDTTVDVTSAANGTSNTVHLNITGGVRIHPSALLQNISPTTDDNYDIAVFSTSTATSGNPVTLDSTAEVLPVPTQAFFIGYGEDAIDPTHDGKKQSASLELNQEKPLVVTGKLAPGVTGPVGNHGDSGGPLFRASDFVFLGVTSYGGGPNSLGDGHTTFARVANIVDWVNDPIPANTSAIFRQNGLVRFIHNKNKPGSNFPRGLCMVQRVNAVELQACRGAFGAEVSPAQAPGWILGTTPASGFFAIVNRNYGLCITALDDNNGSEVAAIPCDFNNPAMQWQFQLTTATPFNTLRIKNKRNSFCLGSEQGATDFGVPITQATCDSGSIAKSYQSWIASR